jgi:hypothetical protein
LGGTSPCGRAGLAGSTSTLKSTGVRYAPPAG